MRFIIGCRPGGVEPGSRGRLVRIIGAGPAGLAAAGYLACRGYRVEVVDAMPEPGGMLVFGVYHGRLPRDRVRAAVRELEQLGVTFKQNTRVGVDVSLGEVAEGADAVLIATGTWRARRLRIPGSDLEGVTSALEYIVSFYKWMLGYGPKPPTPRRAVVVGGGLVAVDAALVLRDAGAGEIHLVYRRTRDYAPAGREEFNRLERMGVIIHELANPVEYLGRSGRVEAVKLVRMRLVEQPGGGRPKPEPIPGSEFTIEGVDLVLEAIGLEPTPPWREGESVGIRLRSDGTIDVDEYHRTTREPFFAAGDVVHGPSRIGPALKSGLDAARSIEAYLEGRIGWRSD